MCRNLCKPTASSPNAEEDEHSFDVAGARMDGMKTIFTSSFPSHPEPSRAIPRSTEIYRAQFGNVSGKEVRMPSLVYYFTEEASVKWWGLVFTVGHLPSQVEKQTCHDCIILIPQQAYKSILPHDLAKMMLSIVHCPLSIVHCPLSIACEAGRRVVDGK